MDYWWLGLLVLALLAIALLLVPVDLAVSLQARGEPNGAYAAAGGIQLGPVAATFVLAQSVPLKVEFRFMGRLIKGSEQAFPVQPQERAEHQRVAPEPRISPVDWLWFLLGERRRISLRWADVQLEYSFRNVALTGQLLAALCVFSAFLPRRVGFAQSPSWELVDRASITLDGRIRLWPGLLLLDSLRFWVRSTMLTQRESTALEPAGPAL